MNPRSFAALAAVLVSSCATLPHPVADTVVGADRLAVMEDVLLHAPKLTAKIELYSEGENPSKLAGVLHFYEGNSLHLTADGRFKEDQVQVDVDGRDAGGVKRTLTAGPNANSHLDPPAPKLREAVALGMSRMGLLHNLARLVLDKTIDHAEGGFDAWVKLTQIEDGRSDNVKGESCRRVNFHIQVDAREVGQGSVCIADATGLPIHRRQTVHFPQGDMTVTESYVWELK